MAGAVDRQAAAHENAEDEKEPDAEVHGRWSTVAVQTAPQGTSSLTRG